MQPEPAPRRCFRHASRMIYVKARMATLRKNARMWQPISTAPFDCDLELAVLDDDGPHALVFPCRRILGGWVKAETRSRIEVHPTHWRIWPQPLEKTG
jgi:hypothetical protein